MPRADTFPTKLLFVCSRNRLRSLTAEKIFGQLPGYDVRSAGTQPSARIIVTKCHVRWADIIFAMERSHANRMQEKFGAALDGKRLIVLNIPDDYEYLQPELVDELEAQVGLHIPLPA
jgi:predicted protein tyrosine phosphatase